MAQPNHSPTQSVELTLEELQRLSDDSQGRISRAATTEALWEAKGFLDCVNRLRGLWNSQQGVKLKNVLVVT